MENEEITQETEEQGNTDTQEEGDGQNQSNEVETLKAQKQHWKEKYQKLEEEMKGNKDKTETKEVNKPKETSDEPDYAKLAFLEQRGVNHPDDIKMVMEESERLQKPLTEILGMKYIQSELKDASTQRKAEAGMPKGRGRDGNNTKADVDYWLAKGETPSDPDLAEKVINARMQKEEQGSKFSEELYTG